MHLSKRTIQQAGAKKKFLYLSKLESFLLLHHTKYPEKKKDTLQNIREDCIQKDPLVFFPHFDRIQ